MRDALGRVQRVLLLGGTSEIGLAIVRALDLVPGAEVILAGRDPRMLAAAASTLRRDRPNLRTAVEPFEAAATEEHGALMDRVFARADVDLVLPAFGVLGDQARAEREPAYAVEVLRVNLLGQASVLLEAGRRLRAQRHGTLVVLSSIAGVRARRANFVYGASKAGVDALGTGLAAALHGTGVRVLVVRPGFVIGRMTTGMPPAPMSVHPDDVAAAVIRALRRGEEVVWVPPTLRVVAAAFRVAPQVIWRRLPR